MERILRTWMRQPSAWIRSSESCENVKLATNSSSWIAAMLAVHSLEHLEGGRTLRVCSRKNLRAVPALSFRPVLVLSVRGSLHHWMAALAFFPGYCLPPALHVCPRYHRITVRSA